jgi:osmoprotectant transport system substrate-binding protein
MSPFAFGIDVTQCAGDVSWRESTPIVIARRLERVVGAVLALLAACATGGDESAPRTALDDDAITVGSFDFAESVLLAEIYSQALERAGLRVERAFGLGPREFVAPAMRAGLIELVPEYAGTALGFVSIGSVRASADPGTTHGELARVLAEANITALAPAPAQNANTFVVTRETAERHDVQRLSDLVPIAGELKLGGPAECEARPLCALGLRERYGLRFAEFVSLDAGGPASHQALRNGDVDVALMFTSDPALSDYVELVDDRALQPAENVTPVVRTEVLDRWDPAVTEVIDAVSGELDTATLRELNAADAAEPGTADVSAVASAWLQSEVGS